MSWSQNWDRWDLGKEKANKSVLDVLVILLRKAYKGLKTIGFSSHSYTPFDTDYCMNEQDTKDYLAQIKLLKEQYADNIHQ